MQESTYNSDLPVQTDGATSYNRQRKHSTIDYMTPLQADELFRKAAWKYVQKSVARSAQEGTGLRNTYGSIFWEIIWRENCVSRLNPPYKNNAK